MGERIIYTTDSDPGIQVVPFDGGISISAQDDWCGDTETGFGATVSVQLTREQVAELHAALGRYLGTPNEAGGE
jgi:hypothetical protein